MWAVPLRECEYLILDDITPVCDVLIVESTIIDINSIGRRGRRLTNAGKLHVVIGLALVAPEDTIVDRATVTDIDTT